MNINDYDINYVEPEERYQTVSYDRPDADFEANYIPNSVISVRGRPDIRGNIDRLEDGEIVVKIMDETYRLPPDKFDLMFYTHPAKSPENWYAKTRSWNWESTV